jgi:membrane protease YdiL (CAAX protease family)
MKNALRSENTAAFLCFAICAPIGYLGLVKEGFRAGGLFAVLAFSLSPVLFFVLLATNRKWRQEYEVQKYLQGHRRDSRLQKWLVALPSILALFVLFFLPVASHPLTPLLNGRFVQYKVPVPWSVLVLRGFASDGYDLLMCFVPTPASGTVPGMFFPFNLAFDSQMHFYAIHRSEKDTVTESRKLDGRAFEIGRGQFLVCCGHEHRDSWVRVYCSAPPNSHGWELNAAFSGVPKDIATFYKILEGTRQR